MSEGSNCAFECRICLDIPSEPVVTMCGHLFCWPCLHRWMEMHRDHPQCPVCKAEIKEKIIPLYERGRESQTKKSDTEESVPRPQPEPQTSPPRPQGHTAPPGSTFHSRRMGPDISFSAGFGLFPGIAFSWNSGGNRQPGGGRENEQDALMSRVFLMIGLFILIWLMSW